MNRITDPIPATQLIAESREQIEGIKTAAGLPDKQFDALCMPIIQAYANHVQALPLSSTILASARGAWEFGLVASMVAYRYAGSVIFFPDIKSEERRALEPQCRYMSLVATLGACLSMVISAAKVTFEDDEYHPLKTRETLHAWLMNRPAATFSWRVGTAPLSASGCAAVTARFVPTGLLAAFDLRVVTMLYDAVVPRATMNGLESTLARVVRESIQTVIAHYTGMEASAFKAAAGSASVTASDASAMAARMTAVANPTLPANPLEPSQVQVQTQAAPAPTAAAPSVAQVPPAAPVAATPTAPAVGQAQGSTPPLVAAPQPVTATNGDPLRNADKVLVEWFSALKLHASYNTLKNHLKVSEEGIEVPINMLGLFGISGASIRKMMETAQLIVRRSDDARHLILSPALHMHFFAEQQPDVAPAT